MEIIYGNKSGEKNNTLFIREEDLEIPHGQDYKIAIKELHKIQNMKINDTSILELFSYNEISLWWFIYQSLISEYKKSANFVDQFLHIIQKTKASKIVIKNDFNHLKLIKQICNKTNIKLEYSKKDYAKFISKNIIINTLQKKRFEKITNEKVKIRKQLFFEKYETIPSIENKIIFAISNNFRRSIFDLKNGKSMRGEFIQKPIMDMLEKDCLLGIDLDYTFKGQHEILSERLNDDIPWVPIECFFQSDSYSKSHRQFFITYETIIKNPEFRSLFSIHDISLWDELELTFKKMTYAPHLPFYLNLLDSLKQYFSKNKPKAIFLPYETGPLALAFISIFKKLDIKTIGVQHGYIYPYSPMYSQTIFSSDDLLCGFPIPDHTLVFGDYVKDLLVKNGYPSKKLEVFGNPSLFDLEKMISQLDLSAIKKKFNIKNNQNIILFTSGKLQRSYSEGGKYDYDEQIWDQLLQNFGGKSEYFIILKPHPGEKNISIYEEIMNKHNHDNVIITQNNIFELILVSSIVLSVFSSTMLESLCFKKPVIRLKFSEQEEHILDSSNSIVTSNLKNLSTNILNLLFNIETKNSLNEKAQKFIKYHYNIPEENPKKVLDKFF